MKKKHYSFLFKFKISVKLVFCLSCDVDVLSSCTFISVWSISVGLGLKELGTEFNLRMGIRVAFDIKWEIRGIKERIFPISKNFKGNLKMYKEVR